MTLYEIKERLLSGDISPLNARNIIEVSALASTILSKNLADITNEDINNIRLIIEVSNILDNNTNRSILFLENGVYDLLVELAKKVDINAESYIVGSPIVKFDNVDEGLDSSSAGYTAGVKFAPVNDDNLFIKNISYLPKVIKQDICFAPISFGNRGIQSGRKERNIAHEYPELAGTLMKSKFVTSKEAISRGVFEDPKITIFERDYIGYYIQMGIINPYKKYKAALKLKYDGISIQATICGDEIESACNRGDTGNDKAVDFTPVLKGYRFRYARQIPSNYRFGMQFEAIITDENREIYNTLKGKQYKNSRTCIAGLMNSNDAYMYRDLITLVPLKVSLPDNLSEEEQLNFLNIYANDVPMKYVIVEGTYVELIYYTKIFTEEADLMRDYMNFMYDGVVFSFLDEDLVSKMGRSNSIDRFSIAIKFNPQCKQAMVTGLDFTVGKTGNITPMLLYTPVEFNGTIHTKSSLHSYARYLVERPKKGNIANVEYTNEVLPYATIPINSHNENNPEPIIPFIDECPCCHSPLVVSDSGKNIYCPNIQCYERNISRISDFFNQLNLKGFSDITFNKIGKYRLKDLLALRKEDVLFLGNQISENFIDMIDKLKTITEYDYKVLGALGFTNIGEETWNLILSNYTIPEVIDIITSGDYRKLEKIKGIGPKTVEVIVNEFPYFIEDIETILLELPFIKSSKGLKARPSVRYTGFRDSELVKKLESLGIDGADKGVTKSTNILLVDGTDYQSGNKYKTAMKYGTMIVSRHDFMTKFDYYISLLKGSMLN